MSANPSGRCPWPWGLILVLLMCRIPWGSSFNLEPESHKSISDPSFEDLSWARDTYFGYSLALQRSPLDGTTWLLVGAPRANSSYHQPKTMQPRDGDPIPITEPGAVFRCDLKSDSCKELNVDQAEMTDSDIPYKEFRNRGWLGASLDSQPTYEQDRQVTGMCAPRWMAEVQYRLYSTGDCYWWNHSLPEPPIQKVVPLDNLDKFTSKSDGKEKYYYGYGQAGMTLHFPSNPKEMILGAPGVYNWRGSVIRLRDGSGTTDTDGTPSTGGTESGMFSSVEVINPIETKDIDAFSLNGYSVTSGYFFDKEELLYASGAPGASETYGKVMIFSFPKPGREALDSPKIRQGTTMGEGFGSSLVAADINGDGFSDLIVGCPSYFEGTRADIGRIEILLGGSKDGEMEDVGSRFGSKVPFARFGKTLAPLGNLNRDKYEDIAVGAPFENGGRGAVYVYLGAETGLRQRAQRLSPSDFSRALPLAGFGMGISRGVDLDGNGYPDLAIGSFTSGHATVLYSRPVANLTWSLTSNPDALPAETSEFELSACVTYDGYNVPPTADIHGVITLDITQPFPRATFREGGMSKNITINYDKDADPGPSCLQYTVDVATERLDPRQPILVILEHSLIDVEGKRMEYAKQDPEEQGRQTELLVGVVADCKKDGDPTCTTDVHVSGSFVNYREGQKYAIGSKDNPVFEIVVDNSGESLFLPNVTIKVSSPFSLFMPQSHRCKFPNRHTRSEMICYLKNPIQNEGKDVLQVTINSSKVKDDTTTNLTIQAEVTGDGEEVNLTDNSVSQKLELKADAKLELNGYSTAEQIFYATEGEDRINTTIRNASFVHYVTLMKTGPTPLERVQLVVDIPVNFTKDVGFITLYAPEKKFIDQEFQCTVTGTTLAMPGRRNSARTSRKNPSVDGTRDRHTPRSDDSEKERVKFDCSNDLVSCARFVCQIYKWPGGSSSATFSIKAVIDFAEIESHIWPQLGADFSSTATASILSIMHGLEFEGVRETNGTVTTMVLPDSMAGGEVPFWAILLAILGSLLLLALIIYGLYKFGFFRRKEREEMKAHTALVVPSNNIT